MAARKPKRASRPEYLVTTAPVAVRCQRCHAAVTTCYVSGEPTVLDPARLNLTGEAVALVLGAKTYGINGMGRDHPYRRTPRHVGEGLPRHGYVHAVHRCGMCYDQPEYRDRRRIFGDQHTGTTPPF